jgi:hypothetical protein
VTIAVTNHLPGETSIHRRGIRVPASMDCVPGLSIAGIDIGRLRDEEELSILMTQCQGGDRDAAGALVHRLSPRLYRYLATPLTQAADLDDLLQDC